MDFSPATISKFFIERPVLANVLAIVMMVLGGVAIACLPVTQYPPITPPTVQVTASYPGATAESMVKKVALPIEQQVNGVDGMMYMSSSSTSTGNYTLTVTFKIGTDPNMDQILVENRVSAALAQLPEAVQNQGVVTKKTSTAFLQVIALTSPTGKYDALFLNNYATINLQNQLTRVPGVGNITIFGIGQYSMRVWLNPDQMQQRSLVPSDVIAAIQAQNVELAVGQFGSPPAGKDQDFQLTININGSLNKASEFEEIIVKSDTQHGGQITRLKDVARVELGSQAYNQFFEFDGKPAGGIAIFQLPGSNAITTAQAVRDKMARLAKIFPEGLVYDIPFDTTLFVKESVNEVYITLLEAGLLVLLVIIIFLQDWRAALVPATTVPVTIIGAFAGMALLGFSINTLTLFAIVLAIGIVVDDAIVVVEGAMQHIEKGKTPKQAAIAAMNSLFGPVIGITLVLMSVFLPAAFMPGIIGQMYRQFALVISVTAFISAINAATLKPTQCALWLKARDPNKKLNVFYRGFNACYVPMERWYTSLIHHLVQHSRLITFLGLLLIALSIWGLTKLPTAFIPTEDQEYVMVSVQLPDAASLHRTKIVMQGLAKKMEKVEAIRDMFVIGGVSPLDNNASLANSGIIYLMLKDWGHRGPRGSLMQIYDDLSKLVQEEPAAKSIVLVPPPIQGLGLAGGFQMQVNLTDGSFHYPVLQHAVDGMTRDAMKSPMVRIALTSFRSQVPQVKLTIDRREAETYGVAVSDVFHTLQTYLGSTFVDRFNVYGFEFNVFVQGDTPFRAGPDQMKNLYVRGQTNSMVPLGSLVKAETSQGPSIISLYNLYPSAAVIGQSARGYSSGQVLQLLDDTAHQVLPPEIKTAWTAMSYQEKLAGNSIYFVFALGILLVYFVLAGQYESWIIPLAVILAVPLALLGTVAVLSLLGGTNNIYVQIGIVLLIALSAKNAILVVEMAREHRAAGESIIDAATHAAANRFRPILMTSITFILGVTPLILATGASAMARKSLGIAVASGMFASTCLAVLFVPSFYVVLQTIAERKKKE
ncbi:MAG: efflux RND transporter permease subunit [Verrucomicrobiota bacterium]